MPTAYAQCIGGHQPLQEQVFWGRIAPTLEGFIGGRCPHQPDHAIDFFQAVVARMAGRLGAKAHMGALHRFLQFHNKIKTFLHFLHLFVCLCIVTHKKVNGKPFTY
jgi:hypothetical protein